MGGRAGPAKRGGCPGPSAGSCWEAHGDNGRGPSGPASACWRAPGPLCHLLLGHLCAHPMSPMALGKAGEGQEWVTHRIALPASWGSWGEGRKLGCSGAGLGPRAYGKVIPANQCYGVVG